MGHSSSALAFRLARLTFGQVKAQRAIVELGLLGGFSVAAGIFALARAANHGTPELGAFEVVLGGVILVCACWVIGTAVHGLREIQGLPETARRMSWPAVAARVSLSSILPVGTVVFLSVSAASAGWILGLGYVVLGGALCAVALLASRVEHLCGARVWRANNRFYFAR